MSEAAGFRMTPPFCLSKGFCPLTTPYAAKIATAVIAGASAKALRVRLHQRVRQHNLQLYRQRYALPLLDLSLGT